MILSGKHINPNSPSMILQDEQETTKFGSDRWLLAAVIMLMMFGLLAVFSSIAFFAESRFTTASNLVGGHIVKLGIAFFVMIIFSKIDYHILAKFSKYAVILSWIFLVMTTMYGTEVWGARRSISLGGFSFQPSTLATVSLLIHVVVMIVRKKEYIKDFKRTFLPMMFWILTTCALIGIEDFSSAALLLGLCLAVMFVGRVNAGHITALILLGAIGGGALIMQTAERQSRVTNYIDQVLHIKGDEFVLNAGYQAQQAHIAVAQGGIFGVGIGKSTQRDFLPAPYNDFIFAIITEEYGLLGAGFLLFIYTLILFRGFVYVAKRAIDDEGMLLAVACTLTVTMYAFVNAAVATGLFPVTGLPMPFISYGGTSMLFSGIMIGILLNISKQRRGLI